MKLHLDSLIIIHQNLISKKKVLVLIIGLFMVTSSNINYTLFSSKQQNEDHHPH